MVRGETPQGGRWLASDAQLAAAYLRHKDGICTGCGQPLEESTADDGNFEVRDDRRRFTYEVEPKPMACHGCLAIDRLFDEPEWAEHKHIKALRFNVTKTPVRHAHQH